MASSTGGGVLDKHEYDIIFNRSLNSHSLPDTNLFYHDYKKQCFTTLLLGEKHSISETSATQPPNLIKYDSSYPLFKD